MSLSRRALALFAALCVFMTFCGCALISGENANGSPVQMYYKTASGEQLQGDTVVDSEHRFVSAGSLEELLPLYLSGPVSDSLRSPYPDKTSAQVLEKNQENVTLQMSGEFFTLLGVDMSVACCCLANTVCGYTGCSLLTLVDDTESIRIEVRPEEFLLSSGFQENEAASFTVYFPEKDHRYLIQETREAILSRNESQASFLMRKLMEGPESSQLEPVFPAGTQILGVRTEEGLCTVNLSSAFLESRSENVYENYTTLYSIVDTLTGVEGISAVQLLVEGETVEFYGIFPIGQPVMRNIDCLGPVRTAGGETDVDLMVLSQASGTSFPVPCRVRQTISDPLAQAVLQSYLSYDPPQGFYNPIPYGTELISVSVSEGRCYVELSDRFIPLEDTEAAELAAVDALVRTLTQLDGISSVLITLSGENEGLKYVDISEPLTPDSLTWRGEPG